MWRRVGGWGAEAPFEDESVLSCLSMVLIELGLCATFLLSK